MYCQKCRYPLQGLTGSACPECGRAFDANNRATWDAAPSWPKVSAVVLLIGMAAVIAMLVGLDDSKIGFDSAFWTRDRWIFIMVPVVAMLAGWWANRKRMTFAFGVISALAVLLANVMDGSVTTRLINGGSVAGLTVGNVAGFISTIALSRISGWLGFRLRVALRSGAGARIRAMWKSKWYRPRNIVLGLVSAVLLYAGWHIIAVLGVANGEPTSAVDYDRLVTEQRTALTRQEPEAAHARWLAFESAVTRFGEHLAKFDAAYLAEGQPSRHQFGQQRRFGAGAQIGLDFGLVTDGDDLPAMLDPERHAIEQLRADSAWAEIERLALGPMPLHEVNVGAIWNMSIPAPPLFWSLRDFGRVSRASWRFDVVNGELERFVDSFGASMAIGCMLSFQGPMIESRSSASIFDESLAELQFLLMEEEFDDATCRRLLAILDQERPASEDVVLAFETAVWNNMTQSTFSDDGSGDGYWLPAAANSTVTTWQLWRQSWKSRFDWPTRRSMTDEYEAGMAYIEGELQRSPHPRWVDVEIFEPWSSRSRPLTVCPSWRPLVRQLESLKWVMMMRTELRQRFVATRLMLAIERYIASYSQPPSQLDDLVPEFLNEIPVDPETGEPLGYQRRDDGRYLIYAYGHDKIDSGGNFRGGPVYGMGSSFDSDSGSGGFDVPWTVPRPKRKWWNPTHE